MNLPISNFCKKWNKMPLAPLALINIITILPGISSSVVRVKSFFAIELKLSSARWQYQCNTFRLMNTARQCCICIDGSVYNLFFSFTYWRIMWIQLKEIDFTKFVLLIIARWLKTSKMLSILRRSLAINRLAINSINSCRSGNAKSLLEFRRSTSTFKAAILDDFNKRLKIQSITNRSKLGDDMVRIK